MNFLSAALANLLTDANGTPFGDWGFPTIVDLSNNSMGIHIPEPSTLALAAAGLAAMALIRRRK